VFSTSLEVNSTEVYKGKFARDAFTLLTQCSYNLWL
jgi:hypothetical protein